MDIESRHIMERAKHRERFNIRDVCGWMPYLSEQTLRSRLDLLVDNGLLEKHGATRNLYYAFVEPYKDIRGLIESEMMIDAPSSELENV